MLDTDAEDLAAAFGLSVVGAATAVHAVLPGMRRRGRGSLLFTTGSGALRPSPDRAASGVVTTAATTWIRLLHEALAPEGVQVAHVVIAGVVGPAERHRPEDVAEHLWRATLDPTTALTLID